MHALTNENSQQSIQPNTKRIYGLDHSDSTRRVLEKLNQASASEKPVSIPPMIPLPTMARRTLWEQKFGKHLDEKLSNGEAIANSDEALHLTAEFGDAETITKIAKQQKVQVNRTRYNGRTLAMSAAASGKTTNFQRVLSLAKEIEDKHTKSMFTQNDYIGYNTFSTAAKKGNLSILKLTLKKSGLKINHLDGNLRSVLHNAAMGGNIENLKYLWGSFFRKLQLRSVRLMKDINNNNALILAATSNSPKSVEFCIKKLKIPIEEKGYLGRTPLLAAAAYGQMENVRTIVEIAKEKFKSPETLQMFLTTTDDHGSNLLDLVCQNGTAKDIEYCLKLLNHEHHQKQLPNAFISAIKSNNLGNIMTVWNFSKQTLPQEEFKARIDNKVINGQNVLDVAATFGGSNSIDFYFNHIKLSEIVSEGEMMSALNAAASTGKIDNIEHLYELLNSHFNSKPSPSSQHDFAKALENAFLITARHGSENSIEFLFKKVSDHSSKDTIQNILAKAIIEAAKSKSVDNIKEIIRLSTLALKNQTEHSSDKLINIKDDAGNSLLTLAAQYGTPQTINYCIEELKLDIHYKNNNGYDALLSAAAGGKPDNIGRMAELKFSISGQTLIEKIARQTFNSVTLEVINIKTPLTVSAEFADPETIEYCVNHLDYRIDTVDDRKRNALICAIHSGNIENVQTVLCLAKITLGNIGIFKLLTQKDIHHKTAVKWANDSSNTEIKEFIQNVANQYPLITS